MEWTNSPVTKKTPMMMSGRRPSSARKCIVRSRPDMIVECLGFATLSSDSIETSWTRKILNKKRLRPSLMVGEMMWRMYDKVLSAIGRGTLSFHIRCSKLSLSGVCFRL